MRMNTDGLVIKEHKTSGDDRLVTVLTRDYGVLRAFVRGAQRIKSRSQCGSQMFSYADFSIYRGRDAYVIDEVQPKEIFFDLRNDIGKLALAQFFCELQYELAPQESEADSFLRLMYKGFYKNQVFCIFCLSAPKDIFRSRPREMRSFHCLKRTKRVCRRSNSRYISSQSQRPCSVLRTVYRPRSRGNRDGRHKRKNTSVRPQIFRSPRTRQGRAYSPQARGF